MILLRRGGRGYCPDSNPSDDFGGRQQSRDGSQEAGRWR